jgi:Zn-dependent peptidase ImmA (M78 family)
MATLASDLAKDVLQTHERWKLPVDPFAIAKDEDIQLAPGDYGEGFDARIEFVPEVKRFVIYYRSESEGRPKGRVNFSIAHELGHFFIPSHRAQLLAGEMHNSVSDFRSPQSQEQEADDFAACLLMPRELFIAEVQRFRQRVCTLSEIGQLAEQRLKTSLTSTARRYVQCDVEACSIVFSQHGVMKWAMHSHDMKSKNMKYISANVAVPNGSKTQSLWHRSQSAPRSMSDEGTVNAAIWFDNPYCDMLWEDVLLLGGTGFAITLLTPDEKDS